MFKTLKDQDKYRVYKKEMLAIQFIDKFFHSNSRIKIAGRNRIFTQNY